MQLQLPATSISSAVLYFTLLQSIECFFYLFRYNGRRLITATLHYLYTVTGNVLPTNVPEICLLVLVVHCDISVTIIQFSTCIDVQLAIDRFKRVAGYKL